MEAANELFASLSLNPAKSLGFLELPQPLGRVPPRALQHSDPLDSNSRSTGSRTWNEQFSRLALKFGLCGTPCCHPTTIPMLKGSGNTGTLNFVKPDGLMAFSRNYAKAPVVA